VTAGDRSGELVALLRASAWVMDVLDVVRSVNPPEWWVGAGVIRDVVWGERFGRGFDPADVNDVDVAFFDPLDLSKARDQYVEQSLVSARPDVNWEAKNQAAVHTWYPSRFGKSVEPLESVADAVATWPETAACVAVRSSQRGTIEVLAPHGLDDLLDGVWRHNPVRATVAEYRRRLARKRPAERWPRVQMIDACP
jgi:hypothetical protein